MFSYQARSARVFEENEELIGALPTTDLVDRASRV